MSKKANCDVKFEIKAADGSGTIDGSSTRTFGMTAIYYMMSPEERADIRAKLDECDRRMKESETENG